MRLPQNLSKRRKIQTQRIVEDRTLFATLMKKRNFSYYLNKATSKHKFGNAEGFVKS